MATSIGQSGHITAAIEKAMDELPAELERIAADGELAELKRISVALNRRLLDRQMREDPRSLVIAIMKARKSK